MNHEVTGANSVQLLNVLQASFPQLQKIAYITVRIVSSFQIFYVAKKKRIKIS